MQLLRAGPFLPILEVLSETGDGGQCIIGQECMKLFSDTTLTPNESVASSRVPVLLQDLARFKVRARVLQHLPSTQATLFNRVVRRWFFLSPNP